MLLKKEISFHSSDRATLIIKLCGQAAARGPRVMTVVSVRVDGPWVKFNADNNEINIWQKPVWALESGDVILCLPWTGTQPAWHFLWQFCSTLYFTQDTSTEHWKHTMHESTPCISAHCLRAHSMRAHSIWELLYDSTLCMIAQSVWEQPVLQHTLYESNLYDSALCMRAHSVWEHTLYDSTVCMRANCTTAHSVGEHILYESTLCMRATCMRAHTVWEHTLYESTLCIRAHSVWLHTLYESTLCMRAHSVWEQPVWEHTLYESTLCMIAHYVW